MDGEHDDNKAGKSDRGPGRPPLYDTPGQLQEAVNAYFAHCISVTEPITITGLALHLGYSSRQGLDGCAARGPEYFDIIKTAKLRVEHAYELQLYRDKPTGAIFALKNMGWRDNQDISFPDGVNVTLPGVTVNLVKASGGGCGSTDFRPGGYGTGKATH